MGIWKHGTGYKNTHTYTCTAPLILVIAILGWEKRKYGIMPPTHLMPSNAGTNYGWKTHMGWKTVLADKPHAATMKLIHPMKERFMSLIFPFFINKIFSLEPKLQLLSQAHWLPRRNCITWFIILSDNCPQYLTEIPPSISPTKQHTLYRALGFKIVSVSANV